MKKLKITLFVVILLLFCKANLIAQENMSDSSQDAVYSLSELYQIALKRAETIKISEEDLYIAERNKDKAISVLFPTFSTFGNYTKYKEEKIYSETVTQPESATTWGLKLSQSFTLNGRELTAFQVAKDSIEKSRYDLDAVKEDYLFNVASAYYDVLKSISAVEIAESNLQRLEKHRNAVAIQVRVETVTKTALYRADAELSSSKAALISAKNQLKLAKAILARIVGVPKIDQIKSPEKDSDSQILFTEENSKNHLAALKKEALENRAEIKALKISEKISDDMVSISKGAYWPVVSIEGAYSDYEQDSSMGKTEEDSLSIGVNLTFTLYDGGLRNAELKEAIAEKRKVSHALENISKQIGIEVEQVWLELITHQSILQSLEDQLEFAKENYNAVTKQFQYGLADSLDVMDANNLLVTSQKQLSESQYDLQLATLKLARVKGTFLKGLTNSLNPKGF